MPLTPYRLMMALRWAGVLAGLAAAVVIAGPFRYADLGLPFPDIVAHALLFYGLGVLMLGALPNSRTADLALALLLIGCVSEVVQAMVGREMSLLDLGGDAAGILLAAGPTYLARFRAVVRTHPHVTFAELRRMDRREGRSVVPVGTETVEP